MVGAETRLPHQLVEFSIIVAARRDDLPSAGKIDLIETTPSFHAWNRSIRDKPTETRHIFLVRSSFQLSCRDFFADISIKRRNQSSPRRRPQFEKTMLISFSVSNYRSFGEEQTLNMVASGKIADHPEHLVPIGETGKSAVRAAVIYGANAAGKSNLVRAMEFAQRSIVGQRSTLANAEPFKFQAQSAPQPSTFEFRFLAEESVFSYGFDLVGKKIHNEWLTVLRGNDDIVIFERDVNGEAQVGRTLKATFPNDESLLDTLWVLAKLPLRTDQLLMNRAISLPESAQGRTLRAVIRWLTQDLLILRPDHRTHDILDRLDQDSGFLAFASQFLQRVGTGVAGLSIEKDERDASDAERQYLSRSLQSTRFMYDFMGRPGEMDIRPKPDDPSRVVSRRLVAQHPTEGFNGALPFSEESDGTRQLLHLMPVLDSQGANAKVIVIDELDRSLHPHICWEFLRFFSETCPGAHKQLIVTTHEAHLLNQELLRRDEYWFVEKDDRQQSRLVPLSDFKVRNDLQIEKGYLQGRFGAIPIIGSMSELEKLLECRLTQEVANAPQEATS